MGHFQRTTREAYDTRERLARSLFSFDRTPANTASVRVDGRTGAVVRTPKK